jgi:hypothetical protein
MYETRIFRQDAFETTMPKRALAESAPANARTGSFLADLLDVNAELPYTTVVEGLEEFLYQSELQPRS